MAVKWTDSQQQVIDSRKGNLLVSAAAGSGKTAVLVERIVQMITDEQSPVELDKLLVMTFTNAAAGEMRERIGRAIDSKVKEQPDNQRLRRQEALVSHAQIQTIHRFCLKLIREHYASLDIDPAFRIGDEGELNLLREDVMKRLLEDQYGQNNPEFVAFVETYGGGRTDAGISEVILQVYEAAVSHPWPFDWLAACKQEFMGEGIEQFAASPWAKYLLWTVTLQMNEYASLLAEAITLAGEPDGPGGYVPVLQQDLELVRRIGQAGDFQELYRCLKQVQFGKLPPARGKDLDKEKKDKVSAIRNQIKKELNKALENYASWPMEEIKAAIHGCAPAVLTLLELTEQFYRRFFQAKQERNIVDFSDLEHLALAVLYEEGRPSAVADELSQYYEEILLDEYQDSNQVQESLVQAISGERFGRPNVFMVGDVKQSIYRFRQARPELFMHKYDTYQAGGPNQKIELRQNFRSRRQVLDSINQVFYQIMIKQLGGIRYTPETALYPGAGFAPLPDEDACYQTQLLLLDTGNQKLALLDDEAKEYTARELEVKLAAEKIRELTDPQTGLMVWDKTLSAYRRARNGDVVILLRSLSGWAENFVNGLMYAGIPAYAQSQAGYFRTVEIETVLSLLCVIDNPIQDIPLAAVLKSPVTGMSDKELAVMMAAFKRYAKKSQDRGIYGAWKFWLEDEKRDLDSAIKGKLKKLHDQVTRFRYLAAILPIHELIGQIYQETGYYLYAASMPGGEVRRANLDYLIEKAVAYEQTSYKGLFHFVRYIERLKKIDTDFGEAAVGGEEDHTVRIMSIHKSKGLEFPIVILAGMGKKMNKQDAYGKLLIDADFGIAAEYLDLDERLKMSTLKKQVLKRKLELETMGEELRALYVAMTRAREKLILIGADPYLERKLEKWGGQPDGGSRVSRVKKGLFFTTISTANSYLDWILMSLPAIEGTIACEQVDLSGLMGQEMLAQTEKILKKEELLDLDGDCIYDRQYREQLAHAFAYVYPYKQDVALFSMMSVSEIKRQSMIEEEQGVKELIVPGIRTEESREPDQAGPAGTGADGKIPFGYGKWGRAVRGNAYHRVLELLDFAKAETRDQLNQQIQQMAARGSLKEAEKKLVSSGLIWAFLCSPTGLKMQQAGKEGRLYKEQQFMIGVPARQLKLADSDELVLIQGMIDAYVEEPDGLVLIDYKTDYVTSLAELKARYQIQLDYYARALTQIKQKPVKEKIIYSLPLKEGLFLSAQE